MGIHVMHRKDQPSFTTRNADDDYDIKKSVFQCDQTTKIAIESRFRKSDKLVNCEN